MGSAGPSCGQIARPRESGQSDCLLHNSVSDSQDTCPVCIPVQILCLSLRTLYTEMVSRVTRQKRAGQNRADKTAQTKARSNKSAQDNSAQDNRAR